MRSYKEAIFPRLPQNCLGFIKPKQCRYNVEADFRDFLLLFEREGKKDCQKDCQMR